MYITVINFTKLSWNALENINKISASKEGITLKNISDFQINTEQVLKVLGKLS